MTENLAPTPPSRWWIIPTACLIACLFLPTLCTPFDFEEDGCLVHRHTRYASSPSQFGPELLSLTLTEYLNGGPCRPVTWFHWMFSSLLHDGEAFRFRLERLILCAVSACLFLLLLTELGLTATASLLATTLACWSTYRSEIWRQLGMPEAFGMLYSLLALWFALRASRQGAPWWWDIAASAAFLAALGVKNTYLALTPALLWLRFSGAGLPPWHTARTHWPRSLYYLLPASLPILHYISLKFLPTNPHFKTAITLKNAETMFSCVLTALEWKIMGLALALLCVLLLLHSLRTREEQSPRPSLWQQPTIIAGGTAVLLLLAGTMIYLPWTARAGRYSMPAVWGGDILFALLLTSFASCRPVLRHVAYALVVLGLLIVGFRTLSVQYQQYQNDQPLWAALLYLEQQQPASAAMRTHLDEDFTDNKRIHFNWHIEYRGRGTPLRLDRLNDLTTAEVILTRTARPPSDNYILDRQFTISAPFGCFVWRRHAPSDQGKDRQALSAKVN